MVRRPYNQNFTDARFVYLNYSHHTYWDRRSDQLQYDAFSLFQFRSLRNLSVSLTGYRYEYDKGRQGCLSVLKFAVGDNSTISYNGTMAAVPTAIR